MEFIVNINHNLNFKLISLLDNEIDKGEIYSPFKIQDQEPRSLLQIAARKIIEGNRLDELSNIQVRELQLSVLKEAKSFAEWIPLSQHCSKDIVEEHSIHLLKCVGVNVNEHVEGIAKKALLLYMFLELESKIVDTINNSDDLTTDVFDMGLELLSPKDKIIHKTTRYALNALSNISRGVISLSAANQFYRILVSLYTREGGNVDYYHLAFATFDFFLNKVNNRVQHKLFEERMTKCKQLWINQ